MNPQHKLTIAGAAIYITAVGIAWRLTDHIDAVDLVIVIATIWLIGERVGLHERVDETRADVDDLGTDMDAVKAHLTGNDQPTSGRHAHPKTEPHYKASPRPRSVA